MSAYTRPYFLAEDRNFQAVSKLTEISTKREIEIHPEQIPTYTNN